MHMSFWWGSDLGDFMFRGFSITTPGGLTGICLGMAALAIVYESMKVIKTKTRQKAAREVPLPGLPLGVCQTESSELIASSASRQSASIQKFKYALRDLGFYIMDSFMSYFLMLSVMLYNGYIFVAVILGTTLGYFVFGHLSRKINMENVQAKTTAILCAPSCQEPEPGSSALTSGEGSSSSIVRLQNETDVSREPDIIRYQL